MVWVILLRLENQFHKVSDLLLPGLGGFGLALLQIGLIDLGRYWITGTWEGFHVYF